MMTPDINPVELKVCLSHIHGLKKGVRPMVSYAADRKDEAFAVNRLKSRRIRFVIQQTDNEASTCVSGRRNKG